MNVALEIAKVVATAIGGESLAKIMFVGRLPASKPERLAAVAASGGEYDGDNPEQY